MNCRTLARRLPDEPRWIDVRGILLSERCRVSPPPGDASGYVARSTDFPLLMVVGRPAAAVIEAFTADPEPELEVLVQRESLDHVAGVLAGWAHEPAFVHTLAAGWAPGDDADPALGLVEHPEVLDAAGLPARLHRDLTKALSWTPIAAWFEGGRPVSFCYPGVQTETWWDVSVDTLAEHRGRGLAGRCFTHMARRMHARGKRPVWVALESNAASLRAAAKLGFKRADRFSMFRRAS